MKRSELPYPSHTKIECCLCKRDITKLDTEAHLWGMHVDVYREDEICTMRDSHRYMMNFVAVLKHSYPAIFNDVEKLLQELNAS